MQKQTKIYPVDRYWQVRASFNPERITIQIWFREALVITYRMERSNIPSDGIFSIQRYLRENLLDEENGCLKGLNSEEIVTDEKAGIGSLTRVLEKASEAIHELQNE